MFGLEKKIHAQLSLLKDKFDLQGIKAEFEAEGSSFRDLVRLRRLTDKLDLKLILKIGGVEAVRDLKDSLEAGVDGLIAPMVESAFGLKKFLDAYQSIYKSNRIYKSINIETRAGVENLDEILALAKGEIDNITVGRTDLSASYFDEEVHPDSEFIFKLIADLGEKIKPTGLTMTVGGSLSVRSLEYMNGHGSDWINNIYRLETRKTIFPTQTMLNDKDCLLAAFRFEELYILSKKEINDLFLESETARLARLQTRTKS